MDGQLRRPLRAPAPGSSVPPAGAPGCSRLSSATGPALPYAILVSKRGEAAQPNGNDG